MSVTINSVQGQFSSKDVLRVEAPISTDHIMNRTMFPDRRVGQRNVKVRKLGNAG